MSCTCFWLQDHLCSQWMCVVVVLDWTVYNCLARYWLTAPNPILLACKQDRFVCVETVDSYDQDAAISCTFFFLVHDYLLDQLLLVHTQIGPDSIALISKRSTDTITNFQWQGTEHTVTSIAPNKGRVPRYPLSYTLHLLSFHLIVDGRDTSNLPLHLPLSI